MAKLTERDIREMRARYRAEGVTQATLAAEFQISTGHVTRILTGAEWPHVGGALEGDLSDRTPPAVVKEVRERYSAGGITQQELADEYDISRSHVANIVAGRRGSE